MIDTFVTFHILPGKTAEFERLHQQLLARISVQPGCANIRVLRSAANPLEYMVHGTWSAKTLGAGAPDNTRIQIAVQSPADRTSFAHARQFLRAGVRVCGR